MAAREITAVDGSATGSAEADAGTMSEVLERELVVFFGSTVLRQGFLQSRTLTVRQFFDYLKELGPRRGALSSAAYHALDKKDREQNKQRTREKDGEFFTIGSYAADKVWRTEPILKVWGISLDFDSCPFKESDFRARLPGVAYVGYTTYSHLPDAVRLRIVIPYSQEVPAERHPVLFDYFNERFDGKIDASMRTVSQASFTPSCPHDAVADFRSFYEIGALFDPSSVPDPAPRATKRTVQSSQVQGISARAKLRAKVAGALELLDSDDYSRWIDYAHAVNNDLGEDGKDLWLHWSAKSEKFDPDYAEETWEKLKQRSPDEPRITCGTILHHAKEVVKAKNATHVDEMNDEFFIASIGSRVAIFQEQYDPLTDRMQILPRTRTDFDLLMENRTVTLLAPNGDSREVNLGKLWRRHSGRRQFKRVVLAPEGCSSDYYNLWQGFSVKPAAGSWEKLRWHLLNVICAGNQQLYEYLLGWLAFCVKRPGERPEVALVLRGGRGSGKGMFLRAIGGLFGPHYLQVSQPSHLTGHFNGHLQNVLFLFADESFYAGDKKSEGVLKTLITEPLLMLERKGFDSEPWPNRLKIVMASNSDWVVPAGADERRFFVLDVADQKKQDHVYFTALQAEINDGGLSAMLHDLLVMDLSTFNVRKAPYTQALVQQKILSMSPVQRWWFDKLQLGGFTLPPLAGAPLHEWGLVPTESVHFDYVRSCRETGSNYRASSVQLGMALPALLPGGKLPKVKRNQEHGDGRCNYYDFPDLEECRRHFERLFGLGREIWPEEPPLEESAKIGRRVDAWLSLESGVATLDAAATADP